MASGNPSWGDKLSYHTLFDTIDQFGTYSGLKVTHDKTEILLLGNMDVSCSELGVDENISKVIKILGVYFTFNHSFLSYFFVKKYLLVGALGMLWVGESVSGSVEQ